MMMLLLYEGQELEGDPGIWMRVWVVGRVWREKKGLKKRERKFGWEGPIYTVWWSSRGTVSRSEVLCAL
jgi:hypothetical protein